MHSIMIICPDNSPLKESEKWLSRYGFHVNTSSTLEQANKYYELTEFHLLLIDQETIIHLNGSHTELPNTPHRIVLDTKPSLSTAINSMAQGGAYYLPLPPAAASPLKNVYNAL